MIVDLAESPLATLPEYDLCVVGSGPAGTTIANELAGRGFSICVLESGRKKPTRHGDRLREVESEGIAIKDWSRERVLGGASTTWAGLSSFLDPIDLEPREWVPHSGWPIAHAELLRWYDQAALRYRFPTRDDFGPEGFGALRARGGLQPELRRVEEKVFLACAKPQDFGREFRSLYESEKADLYLDATVLRLETRPEGDRDAGGGETRVRRARVRTSGGRELVLCARVFVLACGGIENARILLQSRDACPAGLGNERDQVGRRFMNHPKNYYGIVRLARAVTAAPYWFGSLHRGFAGYGGLRLDARTQRERRLLNSYVRLEPLFPWSGDTGVESLVLLAKKSRFLVSGISKGQGELVELRDYSETGDDSELQNERKSAFGWLALFGNIVAHAPSVLAYLWFRLVPGQRPRVRRVRLRNFLEMEPDPENRVTLGEGRDPNGEPLPRVRHFPSELDRRSIVALHEVLEEELARTGLGTLEGDLAHEDPWPIDQDASHHIGSTRMGRDPASSVVDPDLRVHGTENLYLAGASVFPTSGCANPTFTIVALSIRLAEHLEAGVLARGAREGAARA